jgi:hypothetical protein
MKTTEEKFKQLLKIAVDNGFDLDFLPSHFDLWINNVESAHLKPKVYLDLNHFLIVFGTFCYPINNLILNTNFFDCLFLNTGFSGVQDSIHLSVNNKEYKTYWIGEDMYDTTDDEESGPPSIDFMRFQWIVEIKKGSPLEWLFKQFDL